jgi:hypothetical protein
MINALSNGLRTVAAVRINALLSKGKFSLVIYPYDNRSDP